MRLTYAVQVCAVITIAGCTGRGRSLSPIRVEPIVTLGSDHGDGAFATTPRVTPVQGGAFWLVVPERGSGASTPILFDQHGQFVALLDADSSGINQLRNAAFARIGAGDSLWVFDNALRAFAFNLQHRMVRSITLTWPNADSNDIPSDAAFLSNGSFLVSFSGGNSVRRFDAGGTADSANVVRGDGAQLIAAAPDGTVWAASELAPWHISHWSADGVEIPTAMDLPTWADDSVAPSTSSNLDVPPASRVRAIWTDSLGRVWTVAIVPDRHWQHGLVRSTSGGAGHIEPDRYFDTVIEIHDPVSGRLIASSRIDAACMSAAGPGVLVHEITGAGGWRRAELLKVMFDRGGN